MTESQLCRDMGNHFYDRLRALLTDTADTCIEGGMSDGDIMALMLSILMSETTRGAIAMRMTEDEYVEINREAHRRLMHRRSLKRK